MSSPEPGAGKNFIEEIIDADNASGKHGGRVHTRFPPEPNGYLHIGHAKSICVNFGLAQQYGGKCNLRFDDTNPEKEDTEFTDSIQEDVRWLGFTWDGLYYTSDYYQQLHDFAVDLINKGLAYVDHLSPEQIREYRGTLKEPGKPSPYRDRSVDENLALFAQMKAGELDEGSCVLRAKIDMSAPNVMMRDPALYRIKKAHHHRTGNDWCIYPMYDFAHGLSDAIEGITHSICTLEFENNRPLYDWFLQAVETKHRPQQIEFAKLKLNYTVMSKRNLRVMVEEGIVDGWDDPRFPTIRGMRRRGYTPAAIRNFCDDIGVSKNNSTIDIGKLEHAVREDLDKVCPRVMVVLDPIKVVIDNYPGDLVEMLTAKNHPSDEAMGTRQVPFSREVYIDRDDFMEDPPKKFFRLAPGKEVRLRYGYIIKCESVEKDDDGHVTTLHCTYDPDTKGKNPSDGRKVKGTIHWVSAAHAVSAPIRNYDRLFKDEEPDSEDFRRSLNPDSVVVNQDARMEPSVLDLAAGDSVQFERKGYYVVDTKDSKDKAPVFNRVVGLRDSWANMVKKGNVN